MKNQPIERASHQEALVIIIGIDILILLTMLVWGLL